MQVKYIDKYSGSHMLSHYISIEMNLNKGFYFHDDRIKLYSEQDYIAKFWSYPFGKFFGSDENLFIQW